MTREEAMRLAKRLRKFSPPGLSQQQGKRALILYYLKTLEQHLKTRA